MRIFTIGLARPPLSLALSSVARLPDPQSIPGLVHAECLTPMKLGSPILSPGRAQFRTLSMFAAWESEDAIDEFLETQPLGNSIKNGWHLRMSFLRRWGSVSQLSWLPETVGEMDPQAPVAAYTLARMRFLEVPRFVHWGRPVETLVRDDPATTFAMATVRLPNSIATFSIWKTQQAMVDMVRGRSTVPQPERHATAMAERARCDFHHEFTTLRFRPLAEYGS